MGDALAALAVWAGMIAGVLRAGVEDDDPLARRALSAILAVATAVVAVRMHALGAAALLGGWRWVGVVLLLAAPATGAIALGWAYDALRRR